MSKRLLLLLVLLVSSRAAAETLAMDNARTIHILGAIDGTLIAQAQDMVEMAETSPADIYILINSPGGAVLPGNIFIDAMELVKARGVKIKCATTIMAASMAYNILAHCSERNATPNAILLYHPARISGNGALTAQDMTRLVEELNELNLDLLHYLYTVMGMDESLLARTFMQEKAWTAEKLALKCKRGYLKIVKDIKGITLKLYQMGA